jgi:hypothetical protein
MANTLKFFMEPEDEKAFFRFLAQHVLEIYPVRIPADWQPFRANEEALEHEQFPKDALYLAASAIAPVQVDKVKRGPDKGAWRVDEVRSPVIFYERCQMNDDGELVAGKLWAEIDVTPQTGRMDPAPDRFRKLVMEVEEFFKKRFRKGDRHGFWVGPDAARRSKEGLVLRDSEHRGPTVKPYK